MKRAKVDEPAAYERVERPGQAEPEDKTLRQVVAEVVTRPLRIAEVVAGVLDAGYKTTMGLGDLRTHILRVMREAGFKRVDGRWGTP